MTEQEQKEIDNLEKEMWSKARSKIATLEPAHGGTMTVKFHTGSCINVLKLEDNVVKVEGDSIFIAVHKRLSDGSIFTGHIATDAVVSVLDDDGTELWGNIRRSNASR